MDLEKFNEMLLKYKSTKPSDTTARRILAININRQLQALRNSDVRIKTKKITNKLRVGRRQKQFPYLLGK